MRGRLPGLSPDDPTNFSRRLKRHRSDIHPDVRRVIRAWLLMMSEAYNETAGGVGAAAGTVPFPGGVELAEVWRRLAKLCGTLAKAVELPFSRAQWDRAVRSEELKFCPTLESEAPDDGTV